MMCEPKQLYRYRAEGNMSLVMASKNEYVYRLFKTPTSDSKMSQEELIARQGQVMSYVKHVMKPLIGKDLVTEGKKVTLTEEEMKTIQQSLTLENVRPTSRLGKTVDESYVLAMQLPDFCFIPGSTSRNPTFCVEIKPKRGFVSTVLNDDFPSHSREPTACKYCMLQYSKLKSGRCNSVSRFCPVDFFSGDRDRMRHALNGLFETPQNNLRLFVNGKLVYSEDQSSAAERSARLHDIVHPLINRTQNGHNKTNSIEYFCDLLLRCLLYEHKGCVEEEGEDSCTQGVLHTEAPPLSSVRWRCAASSYPHPDESSYSDSPQLPYESVLARILRTQLLGAEEAKGVYPYYAKLKHILHTNPQLRQQTCLDGPFQMYTQPCQVFDDPELNLAIDKLKPFLVSKTAMDCQIMLAIQVLDSGDFPAPGAKILTDGNRRYQFHTAVIDLDPKSVDRMESYMRDAVESMKSYHEALGRSDINTGGIKDTPSFPDWMGDLPPTLHELPLNQLAIPGSHDSTAFFLDKSVPPGPDCDSVLKDLCKWIPQARTVVYNWSKTQALTYTQQLEAGIRYLDMRVSTMNGKNDLYLVHGLYSHMLKDMATAVNEFLEKHPKEVILLDFNHFYGMTDDQHRACLEMIAGIFGNKMCPYLDAESLTLSMLWENHLQVVAFYQHSVALENFHFWPAQSIVSPWANTPDAVHLIKFLEMNYEKKRDMSQFYVTQGVLTPDASTITAHLFSTLEAQCSEKCGNPFVKWLQGKKAGGNKINVCILDYVEQFNYIPVILQLNKTLADNL